MKSEIFDAVLARITAEPHLNRATKAERQAAFRARRMGLKLLEKAAHEREFDETVLDGAFKRHGLQLVRHTSGYSLITDGDGLGIRRRVVKALREYCRLRYVAAYNAARPGEKTLRAKRRGELAAMGIDLTRFREVCDVIDRTGRKTR